MNALVKAEKMLAFFEASVLPVMQYLNDNHNPHTTIIITPTTAELLEGRMSVNTTIFVKD